MAKQSGLGDGFIVGGYDLSGTVGSVDQISGGPALLDVTPINALAHVRISGLRSGGMQFTSYADITGVTPAFTDSLHTLPTADTMGTYLRGTVLGNPAACCNAKQVNYDPTRGADGAITIKAELQSNGFGLEWGEQLTAGLRTDTAATNGTALDNGASSSFGLQAYLQVTAFTGTDITITVAHSADGTTYSSLSAFTQVTAAPSWERKVVTGTVDEYLRVSTTTSGGFTSATFCVVVVRNATAVVF